MQIDCARRRILRDGEERPLSRKAFDLLVVLVDQRPKVVSKDKLIQKIWADTFVADANLAILIGDVRAALGDNAKEPRMIKTHHRVGYSFAADVTEVSAAAHAEDGPPSLWLLPTGASCCSRAELRSAATPAATSSSTTRASREHAVLTVTDGQLTVADRDNGTRVDGRKLTDTSVVRSGQRITFGTVEATVLGRSDADSTMTAFEK